MPPLAERLRPKTLDDYIGQKHLVGPGAVLRKMIDAGRISSFILWGPPGVGKTTLAQIIANKLDTPFYTLSAVTSGVKDVRDVIERAKSNRFFSQSSPILFIDEIHRFSKSQQDSLLGAVEQGTVTLIGATTENPSFEVIRPLLSRCQLYVLKSLEKDDLQELLQRAITTDIVLKERKIELEETTAMLRYSGGDARKLLNILELVVESETPVYYAADSGELPMRWYKFVIWVQLFLSALLNVGEGIIFMTGTHYKGQATVVYMVYGGLKALDVVMGIMMFICAGVTIWVRQMLSKFKKNAPIAYVALLALGSVIVLMYVVIASIITGIQMFSATIISQIVASIALCICNYIYFNKRKSMFVN